jgi:hypothetical protein
MGAYARDKPEKSQALFRFFRDFSDELTQESGINVTVGVGG